MIYFSKLVFIVKCIFLKFRFKNNIKVNSVLKSFLVNNFFFKKNYLFLFEYYINLYKVTFKMVKIDLYFFEYFLFFLNFNFNSFMFLMTNLLNIFKLYKRKKKIIRIINNFKGVFFSKFYRKWKFIKFPTIKF